MSHDYHLQKLEVLFGQSMLAYFMATLNEVRGQHVDVILHPSDIGEEEITYHSTLELISYVFNLSLFHIRYSETFHGVTPLRHGRRKRGVGANVGETVRR